VLKHVHVVSILKHFIAIGEGSFRLGLLSGGPPLSLFDMFFMTRRDLGT
jgi:hypothetical protein